MNKEPNYHIVDRLVESVLNAVTWRGDGIPPLSERRILKLMEEAGEVSEAFTSSTSPANRKKKTTEDVLEEAVDCALVSLDIAWRAAYAHNPVHAKKALDMMLERKLNKWLHVEKSGIDSVGE